MSRNELVASRWNNRDFNSAVDDNNDDSWLLNRFRFGLTVKPVSWLKLYGNYKIRAKHTPFAQTFPVSRARKAMMSSIFDKPTSHSVT